MGNLADKIRLRVAGLGEGYARRHESGQAAGDAGSCRILEWLTTTFRRERHLMLSRGANIRLEGGYLRTLHGVS